jgi:tripartite ATP-independent transporter DctP family solute receptor
MNKVSLSLGLARELAGDLEVMARELTSRIRSFSRGTLNVELVAMERGRDLVQLVRYGKLDMVIVPNAEIAAISHEFDLLELPFLFKGREHAAEVLKGRIGQELLVRLERVRLRGLAYWDLGEMHISTRNRPIRDAKDLRGLHIAIASGEEYMVRIMKELGAQAMPVSTAERYTAMQRGVVDGTEVPIRRFIDRAYQEVQHTLSLTRHRYLAAPVLINFGRFDSLSRDHREQLETTVRQLGDQLRTQHQEEEGRLVARIRNLGVEVIQDPDMRHAHEIGWKVAYWEYAKKTGLNVIEAIERQR